MSTPEPIAVVGVSGYTGFELAKLLLRHPAGSTVTFFMRDTQGAHCLSELFPRLLYLFINLRCLLCYIVFNQHISTVTFF